jgi:hypothetical protein
MSLIMTLIGYLFPPEIPQVPDVQVDPALSGFEAIYVPPGHVGPIVAIREDYLVF